MIHLMTTADVAPARKTAITECEEDIVDMVLSPEKEEGVVVAASNCHIPNKFSSVV
jgi:hypothetical protein